VRREWSKHVRDYFVIKLTFVNPSAFVGPFNKMYTFDKCMELVRIEHLTVMYTSKCSREND